MLLILCHDQHAGTLNGAWPEISDGIPEREGQGTRELPEAALLILTENKNGHPDAPILLLPLPHSFSQGRTLGEHSDLRVLCIGETVMEGQCLKLMQEPHCTVR